MEKLTVEGFNIIGIATRTINNGQELKDIPALWNRFMSENVIAQIPNKIDGAIYCVYTDYEGDYTNPYTTVLGCKVSSLTEVPDGLVGRSFAVGTYTKYVAEGNLMQNPSPVYTKWQEIWRLDNELPRAYTADFEVYGEKAANPTNAAVEILIALK